MIIASFNQLTKDLKIKMTDSYMAHSTKKFISVPRFEY